MPSLNAPIRLIVNADDFGFTRGVNNGIVGAHRHGILTSTTLMAYGVAFNHAVELAHQTPTLDVGVHLVLWDNVLWNDSGLPQRLPAFIRRAMRMSISEIERLFGDQVERVISAGISPSHLDTHKHTHALPHVMRAMENTALRFGVKWVRRPLLSLTRRPRGLRVTDHFLGLALTGRMTRESLGAELQRLRPGLSELMCHPGHVDGDLESAATRLKEHRQREYDALTAPEIRALLEAKGVQLTNYRISE